MRRKFRTAPVWALLPATLGVISIGSTRITPAEVPAATTQTAAMQGRSESGSRQAGPLDVRIHPEKGKLKPVAELLLYDPEGRKTGKNPKPDRAYQEIPSSYYERESLGDNTSGSPGPETAIVYVRDPPAGEYRLQVIGRSNGKYDLEISGADSNGGPSRVSFTNVKIAAADVHRYSINYPNKPGAKIAVRME